jgi:hypothetical protein
MGAFSIGIAMTACDSSAENKLTEMRTCQDI